MAWSPFNLDIPEFQYPSLRSKPRTFRIIKLLPSSRSLFPPFREKLNIQIIETSVDDAAGAYDALSYCWGSGAANRQINILVPNNDNNNGEHRTLRISASLEEALLSLARQCNAQASRPVFADQICIHQSDNVEKIQQMRLMGLIYARSARTIVWLGDETPETRRYFNFSSEVSSEGIMSRVLGPNKGHLVNVFNFIVDSSIEVETAAEKEDRKDILDLVARYGLRFPVRGMAEFFRRAWIGRLWTVQEGCLPADLTFRCGGKSLCFGCFHGSLNFYYIWINYHYPRNSNVIVSEDEVRLLSEVVTLSKLFSRLFQERRMVHGTKGSRRSLYNIVLKYNVNDKTPKVRATKAEDHIYALLGLANNDDIARETVEAMEVDNARGTYTKFAASVIKRNVDVLLFSQMPKSPAYGHQLPSWVPDWSAEQLRTPYGYSDLTTPVFSAGGCQGSHHLVADVSKGTLRVDAIPGGRVVRVGVHSIQRNHSTLVGGIQYTSVRRFFEELNEFMQIAVRISPENAPDISDEERRLKSMTRLSDGGLSVREFPTVLDPTTAQAVLQEIHVTVSHLGKGIIGRGGQDTVDDQLHGHDWHVS